MTSVDSKVPEGVPRWKRAARAVLPQWVKNRREAEYYLKYGEIELHLLDCLCDPTRDSVDVGAHDGCYVHFLRRYSRHVHAYEPLPWLAAELARKFPHDVTVRPEALSCSEGVATLRVPKVGGSSVPGLSTISESTAAHYEDADEIAVPLRTLDASFSGDAGFIKIDVEGHEESVLAGAVKTIERSHPNMIIEILESFIPGGVRRITDFLGTRGYDGFFLRDWRLLPVQTFDAATMQRDEDMPSLTGTHAERVRPPPFVGNFIFLSADRPSALVPRLEQRLMQLAAEA